MRPLLILVLGLLLILAGGCSKKVVVIKASPAENNQVVGPSKNNIKLSDSHLKQAKKHYARQKYNQTKKQCEKAIYLDHRNWEAHYYLGLAMQKKKKYALSIEAFGTGLKYCSDNGYVKSEIHLAIGISWEKLGKLENARKEYNLALKLNPDNQMARNARNRIKVEKTLKNWGKKKDISYEG